jgi:hypothetical protein
MGRASGLVNETFPTAPQMAGRVYPSINRLPVNYCRRSTNLAAPSIEIPHEPTLRRSDGPPEGFALPITAGARLGFFGGLSVFTFLPIGTVAVVCGGIVALAVWGDLPNLPSFGEFVVALAALTVANFGGIVLGCVFTMLSDRLRPNPVLTIESGGLRDTRLWDGMMPWSAVTKVSIVHGDPYTRRDPVAVRLTLNRTVIARHNRFRPGALAFCWAPRSNELYVPLYFLTRPRHVLAHAVATLANGAGAAIVPEIKRGQGREFALAVFLGALALYALPYLLLAAAFVVPVTVIISKLFAPMARRRGWFAHGRLNAHMNRPAFDDDTHRGSAG